MKQIKSVDELVGEKIYLIEDVSQDNFTFWSLIPKCDEDEIIKGEYIIDEEIIGTFNETDEEILVDEFNKFKVLVMGDEE